MLSFALNHVSVAQASLHELLDVAAGSGCVGVELRNDLDQPLFGGLDATDAGALIRDRDLTVFALAEVYAFNRPNPEILAGAAKLVDAAVACGALGVCLIPANDGAVDSRDKRIAMLHDGLEALLPLLREADILGLVEPLGFETASLRYKAEAVQVIDALDAASHVKIIHDTFHHHLAGETQYFPQHTAMVHVSGVVDTAVATAQMTDSHRVLVDDRDRLQNIGQIDALIRAGYTGPVSMEAFASQVHQMTDPVTQLAGSYRYIADQLDASAA